MAVQHGCIGSEVYVRMRVLCVSESSCRRATRRRRRRRCRSGDGRKLLLLLMLLLRLRLRLGLRLGLRLQLLLLLQGRAVLRRKLTTGLVRAVDRHRLRGVLVVQRLGVVLNMIWHWRQRVRIGSRRVVESGVSHARGGGSTGSALGRGGCAGALSGV